MGVLAIYRDAVDIFCSPCWLGLNKYLCVLVYIYIYIYIYVHTILAYLPQAMTDAVSTNDIVLLTDTPIQSKSLMHDLKQTAGGICFYMNWNKIEFMYSKQEGAIPQ